MADSGDATEDKRARFEATALGFTKSLYGAALRLTHSAEDASDLVQDTLLRAYRGFESFAPGTNCKAWLFTILYSSFVNRYRKQQREPPGVSIEELEGRFHVWLRAPEQQADAAIAAASSEEVERALRQLPESFRSVVLMVDLEELSYEEAAAALGCPVGTLRSRLHRARKLLFAALQGYARQMGYLKGSQARS